MDQASRQQKRAAARAARKQQNAPPPAATPSGRPPPVAAEPRAPTDAVRERWRAEALALAPEEVTFGPSVRVLLDEAPRAARFVERYWEPTVEPGTGAVRVPGLKGTSRHLTRAVGGEIVELHGLTQEAHGRWLLASGDAARDAVTRGRFVLDEMQATLQFVADEGGQGDLAAQLARVKESHAQDGESREDLASSLHDWSVLAGAYADALDGVGGFDRALIGEAQGLSTALRALPGAQQEAATDAREKIDLRNRYAALLFARVSTVRSVARFVFRHHPQVAREVTSAWERARRAASRKKKSADAEKKPAGGTTPAAPK